MEREPNRTQETLGKDTDHRGSDLSYSTSLGMHADTDLPPQNDFLRRVSSDRISNTGSSQRRSISLSNGGNSTRNNPSNGGGNTSTLDEMVWSVQRQDSFSSRSSLGSLRRGSNSLSRDLGDRVLKSISLSREFADQILGGVDSSMIAQMGDSGDRVTMDDRDDVSGSRRVSMDVLRTVESGTVALPDGAVLLSNGSRSRSNHVRLTAPVVPVEGDMSSPPTEVILHLTPNDPIQDLQHLSLKDNKYKLPKVLDYTSYLIHLASFGILGVLTRYLLQKLFGPSCLALTADNTPLYLDLPSNMVPSSWGGSELFSRRIYAISPNI